MTDRTQFHKSGNSGSSGAIEKELIRMFKNPKDDDARRIAELRDRYKDKKMIDEIFSAYKTRQREIEKKARKIATVLDQKYANKNVSFDELMRKAVKMARKYKIRDAELDTFKHYVLSSRKTTNQYNLPNTKMAKVLGYSGSYPDTQKLVIQGDKEASYVNDILKLHAETKHLHSQIALQSLTYLDCAPEAINGGFDPTKHNSYDHIHPVLFALFVPRFPLIDEHVLISNIGGIVKSKKEGRTAATQPDYELQWDLITDPNEHVCSKHNVLLDLKNRFILQTRIWDCVLNLRQGKYYLSHSDPFSRLRQGHFLLAIDNCKSSIFEAPDLTYVKDEGAILRRIFSTFALRPTIVATTKLHSLFSANPLISTPGVTQITTIPMVNIRLPLNVHQTGTPGVHLSDALEQPQWYVENRMIVPKSQSILHSRDILVFYVNRRFQTVNIAKFGSPYNFTKLPMTVAGWEAINERPVQFDENMMILKDSYKLRSVICVEKYQEAPLGKQPIIGCTALVVKPANMQTGFNDEYMLYDPFAAGYRNVTFGSSPTVGLNHPDPVTIVSGINLSFQSVSGVQAHSESFYDRASKRGTVFIYKKMASSKNLFIGV